MQKIEKLGYFNGEWGPLEEMEVPFLDRSSFYGDGVYDATMTQDGVILYEQEHIDRFYRSADLMQITIEQSKEELAQILREMVSHTSAQTNFLYWQVTRGTDFRHHTFPDCPANLWIMITPDEFEDLSVKEKLITVEDTRFYHCNAKTLNLLPNVLASEKAKQHGCYEAVFVRDGMVTECAHSNVHILKDGTLITHQADNLILPGIARAHLIAMCKKLGVGVEERPFTRAELMDADEVIVSSSSTFAVGVSQIDGVAVGGKSAELLATIQHALNDEFTAYITAHK
jgi:D-alanine transaminase